MRAAFRHVESMLFWDNRWRTQWNDTNGHHYPGWLMPDFPFSQIWTFWQNLDVFLRLKGPIPAPTDIPVDVPQFPPPQRPLTAQAPLGFSAPWVEHVPAA
jgi:hypothetical protein